MDSACEEMDVRQPCVMKQSTWPNHVLNRIQNTANFEMDAVKPSPGSIRADHFFEIDEFAGMTNAEKSHPANWVTAESLLPYKCVEKYANNTNVAAVALPGCIPLAVKAFPAKAGSSPRMLVRKIYKETKADVIFGTPGFQGDLDKQNKGRISG